MFQRRGESCFFADLCLLLPLTNRPEIDVNFIYSILQSCYLFSSVKEKFDEYLNSVYDYILKDLRDNLPKYLQSIGCTKLSDNDGLLFESFFAERRKQLRADRTLEKRSKSIYFTLEGYIESWIVSQIHSLKRGVKVPVEDFLPKIYRELSNKCEELKSPVETLDVITIEPKQRLKAEALLQGIKKEEDENHIASAIEYQYTENKWVIFLTYDEKHILHYAQNLHNNCALHVSKPIYAIDHRRELSKEPAPLEHFRQIENPSHYQKRFAKALLDVLSIAIFMEP